MSNTKMYILNHVESSYCKENVFKLKHTNIYHGASKKGRRLFSLKLKKFIQ